MAMRVLQLSIVFTIVLLASGTFPVASVKHVSQHSTSTLALNDPQDVIVARGHSATFRCDVRGLPDAKHTWLFNNEVLNSSLIKSQLLEDGALYLPKVGGKLGPNYQGYYRCNVSNPQGLSLLSLPARLQIASIDREFKEQFLNASVIEHQSVLLPCSIFSVPNVTVVWEKDGEKLPQNSRFVPHPSGALIIIQTLTSDTGIYRCRVTNDVLNKTRVSKGGLLTVTPVTSSEANLKTKPVMITDGLLVNVTARLGENVTLYCLVTGSPRPTVKWSINGFLLGTSNALTFQVNSLNDSGVYKCTASNSVGNVTQTFNLTVYQSPYFNVTPSFTLYPVAKLVRLKCQPLGYPKPKITWLKNGVSLENNPRIHISDYELKINPSYTFDAGLYQCIANNAVGTIWTSANLTFVNTSSVPRAPVNISCESYNDTSICIRFEKPSNVMSAAAYTVHYHDKLALLNETFKLIDNLNSSTNYSFTVRLYTNQASDASKSVNCFTAPIGVRHLKVQKIAENSVEVTWNKLTNDVPCIKNPKVVYKLEWRRFNQQSINSNYVEGLQKVLMGFVSSLTYEFRVNYSDWFSYTIPLDDQTATYSPDFNNTILDDGKILPAPPYQLDVSFVTSKSINLTWNDANHFDKTFTVCFYELYMQQDCFEEDLLNTPFNNIEITHLTPNNEYEFKVRTHNKFGTHGPWSPVLRVRTKSDLPSVVREIKYNVLNRTAICLKWRPPLKENGKLLNYLVTYTPDINRPIENWYSVNVSTNRRKAKLCRGDQEQVSVLIANLRYEAQYHVVIRAETEVGLGNPVKPVTFSTKTGERDELIDKKSPDDVYQKQKLGIALGGGLAVTCIIVFILCIFVHKRRLKRQAIARVRYTSSNYFTGTCTPNATVQLQNSCVGEAHEMEHLVNKSTCTENDGGGKNTEVKNQDKMVTTQLNGVLKHQNANKNATNGHVHITENPQFYSLDQNGHSDLNKYTAEPMVEDTNSNLRNTHLDDLKKLYEVSRSKLKLKESPNGKTKLSPNLSNLKYQDIDSSLDNSLNSTALTCLDTSDLNVTPAQYLISSPLGPNG